LRLVVKGHGESFVFVAAEDGEKKIDGGVLLELDAVANAVGSVQQDADAEGEIGLFAEITDFLGKLVIENLKSVFSNAGTSLLRRSER